MPMLRPFPTVPDLKHQSVPIPSSQTADSSSVYKSGIVPKELIYHNPDGDKLPDTVFEIFELALKNTPNQSIFRSRVRTPPTAPGEPHGWSTATYDTTYAQAASRRNALGSALLSLERLGQLRDPRLPADTPSPVEVASHQLPAWGDKLKAGARRGWGVGIWCLNREEWQIVDLACHAYGLVGVSLYETLGPDTAKYITNHAPLAIIFSSSNHVEQLLRMAPETPSLRAIVSVDPIGAAERTIYNQWAASLGLTFYQIDELEEFGNLAGVYTPPGPAEDEKELDKNRIMSISYTSGTTGNPKGVMLSNWNMTSAVNACTYGIGNLTDGFRHFSFLPLAHIYERLLQFLVMIGSGTICFATGDVTKIMEDAQIMKPHFMPGVPRIWNRIYAAINLQMQTPGLKGALLRRAISAKLANFRKDGTYTHAIYDRLVFNKIRGLVGGEVKYMLTGSAPLAPKVQEFLAVAFCVEFAQGYGLTETCASVCRSIAQDTRAPGTCGFLAATNEAKLLDVPEMNYLHTDKPNPRGELLLRGTNIFTGYLHDEENTKKALTPDGWFRTGDVAEIDSAGRIKIIDRVKNVIKLSQGEYVPLEKVEGVYLLNPMFASVYVHGDSFRHCLVGVVIVDPVPGAEFVNKLLGKNIQATDLDALDAALQDPKVVATLQKGLDAAAKRAKLNGFEQVRGVYATANPFPADLLTPTQKLKRNVAAEYYKPQIDRLYDEIEKNSAKL